MKNNIPIAIAIGVVGFFVALAISDVARFNAKASVLRACIQQRQDVAKCKELIE